MGGAGWARRAGWLWSPLMAVTLVLPWNSSIAGGRLASAVEAGASAPTVSELERVWADYQIWRNLAWFVPRPLRMPRAWPCSGSLARRQWAVAACTLWVAGLAALVAGRLIRLPSAQSDAELCRPHRPLHPHRADGRLKLLGEIARVAQAAGSALWRNALQCGAIFPLFLALALAGLPKQMRIVGPHHILVARPDVRAMAWIRENVPGGRFVPGGGFLDIQRAFGRGCGRRVVGSPFWPGEATRCRPSAQLLNEAPARLGVFTAGCGTWWPFWRNIPGLP